MFKADCPFCRIASHDVEAVIVYEDSELMAILDKFPATRGHTLVLTKEHIENIYSMPVELGARIMALTITLSRTMKRELSPDGLNLIQSNDIAAGQTIPHFHLHIVPRYKGDPVLLKFGHGTKPANLDELKKTALLFRTRPIG